ncbi:MAG: aminotransferase class I/II-fold pyridoxal phosphate-dependent enzyme [Pyrinomonadaceae bacterium]|nr:aminotransferase class I/II-fold pyridoxal phosphate-dependent enzyme [Pyrinomonadaceae bacterium]
MKTSRDVSDLAIFGNSPAFAEKLYVGRPNVGDTTKVLERIKEALDNRWLTNHGPLVQELERRIAKLLGVKHCIAMCNGTVALEILIRALELSGEVIIPSFTFVATAHALQWQEITPVFCDINPETHSIDPRRIEELITPRTSGIIGVHLWGRGCDVEQLSEIARNNSLKLIFDAAHAFACSHGGKMIGGFGEAEVFSFHATKCFNTFEGGAVVTNNDELAAKIRLMNNFGFAGYDNVIYIGTNGKMSEISAAMGLTGLDGLNDFISVNRRNYERYRSEFEGLPGVRLFPHDQAEEGNYHYVIAEIDEELVGVTRDLMMEILWAENVIARRYFYPGCHRMEPYRSLFPTAGGLLPKTEELTKRVLVLPTGTAVNEIQIAAICEIIRLVLCNAKEVTARLNSRHLSTPLTAAEPITSYARTGQ